MDQIILSQIQLRGPQSEEEWMFLHMYSHPEYHDFFDKNRKNISSRYKNGEKEEEEEEDS